MKQTCRTSATFDVDDKKQFKSQSRNFNPQILVLRNCACIACIGTHSWVQDAINSDIMQLKYFVNFQWSNVNVQFFYKKKVKMQSFTYLYIYLWKIPNYYSTLFLSLLYIMY